MSFSFHTPFEIVLACIAAAAAASWYGYRFTVPKIAPSKRYFLIVLRALSFSFILIALFESQLTLSTHKPALPALAVLIDNSLSMTQSDNGKSREEITREILASSSFRGLAAQTNMKLFQFSHALAPLIPESLRVNGGTTNISSALEEAQRTTSTQLQGILLITDGNYNEGANPLYDAEKSPFPLFIAGAGDTTEQKDILLSKLSANTVGYVGTSLPVDVTVKASGISSASVTVSLYEDAKKVADQTLRVRSDGNDVAEFPVRFTYTPSEPGVKKLLAKVSGVAGEFTEKNNVQFSTIKILKSKLSVIVIAGTPHPDVSAVMQSLSEQSTIDAVLFTQSPDGDLHSLQTSSPLSAMLVSADCLILDGYPTQQTPDALVRSLVATVSTRSLALFFIAGRSIDQHKVRLMEPVLPFRINSGMTDEQAVFPVLTGSYRLNSLVRPPAESFPLFSWDKLPPIYTSLSAFVEKEESKKLLTVKLQGIPLRTPLFVSSQHGRSKSLALLGYGLFRWQLLAASAGDTRGFFSPWFASLVRWLATTDDDKLFHVEPAASVFAQGAPIEFSGQLFNDTYDPVDNADIQLSIRSSSGETVSSIGFTSTGSGRYTASAPELPQGEYLFSSTAMIGGDTLATSAGRFSVGEQLVEFSETRMNQPLLQQMAHASSGLYVNANRFDSLARAILQRPDMKPVDRVITDEFQLWNLPSWLSVIVLFFGIEWFVRKRSGML
ncbi:MAG: hypothetical protein WCT99_07125 [Bacteroidota bacterium]